MKKIVTGIVTALTLFLPGIVAAQVFSQYQLINQPLGGGVVVSTSTKNGDHLGTIATSSLGLLTTNVAEGSNLYFTTARDLSAFITNLAATTSVASITTLSHLSLPYSQLTGTPVIASSTLLSDSNTFSGVDLFTNAASNFSGTWQTFSPSHFQTALSTPTWPIILTGTTISFGGLSTTTNLTQGQIPYVTGVNTFGQVSTTSVTCTGNASCTSFTAIGASPITINVAAGTAASSTLLGDSNTFSGTNNIFTNLITGSISGNAGTATKLATGRTISITGDLAYTSPSFDGSGNVTAAGTLATVNSNVGTFIYPSVTVNGKGLITAISNGTAPIIYTGTFPIQVTGSVISSLFSTTTNSGMTQGFQYVGSGGIFQTAASSSFFGFTPQPAGTYVTAVNGTANQITSSGGTTPTLSLPNHVIFPIDYVAISGSTTNSTTTNFAVVGAAENCNGTSALTTSSTGVLGCTAQPQGTVTAVSVASSNGFAGTSSGGATPALTLSTTITGLLKGNGTAISAASPGTDYDVFTYPFPAGATSSPLTFTGLITTTNASTTLFSSVYASSTRLFAGSFTLSTTTAGCLNTSSGGIVYAATCSTGGSLFPFTPTNNFGINTNATSTAISFFQGLFASSTSVIASTTFAINGNVGIGSSTPYAPFSMFPIISNLFSSILIASTSVYSSSGTFTWVAPVNEASIVIQAWGAGGAGGTNGGGGGAGAFIASTTLTLTPGSSHTIVIGQGGQAVNGGTGFKSGGAGNATAPIGGGGGGSSSFDSSIIACGGGGGGGGLAGNGATAATGASGTSGGIGGAGQSGAGGGGGGGCGIVGGAGGNPTAGTAGTGGTTATGISGSGGTAASGPTGGGGGSSAGVAGNGNTGNNGSGSSAGGTGGAGSNGATGGTAGGGSGTNGIQPNSGGGGGGGNSTSNVGGIGGNPGAGAGGGGGGQGGGNGGNGEIIITVMVYANSFTPLFAQSFSTQEPVFYGGVLATGSTTIGIGTSTPQATLDVYSSSNVFGAFIVHIIQSGIRYIAEEIDQYGHLITGGPTPSIVSCGTSPLFVGAANDRNMVLQIGSGVVSSCTVTWANPYPTNSDPVCPITELNGSSIFMPEASTTSTGIVLSGGTITSNRYAIHCEVAQ